MKKFYAIKNGYDFYKKEPVVNKIVRDWDTCSRMVKGVKNAQYKSFKTLEEANIYLGVHEKKEQKNEKFDGIEAYVDGSFNIATERFSYGLVILKDNTIVHAENGVAEDDSKKKQRQIAGELLGAERALEYACESQEKQVKIYHDYVGVRNHVTGEWQRKEESSQLYYEKMNRLINENDLNVEFVKVDSHTGDLYNEVVDELAKVAGGVRMNNESNKLIKKNKIYVANEDIKNLLHDILGEEALNNVIVK
ncbi:ribonuclease H family protein [Oceanirhabdus sp. W0125-5]|uniref:ribonuclease H family protein n=1 Tax=Oceanirhabdus sp. W0125-5 TaxID=2999116 RepID=UPI0022F31DBC|nr:ribonuclease H family protein [Oceanirhabdus sp. W0125-5]WBW98689.1 ribonuclease H family protein [Oceanirhabdus sp. W0125-5]